MTRFDDGPAAGHNLELKRAPLFMRVTCFGGCKWDALDQLDDVPTPSEEVYAYRRHGQAGTVHIDYVERGRRKGKWLLLYHYRYCQAQPDDATLRDNAAWAEWCKARHNDEKTETNTQPHERG